MRTYITFAVESLADGQRIISAVSALGIEPTRMFYELPTAAGVVEDKPSTVAKLTENNIHANAVDEPRKNVSPGEPSITKIGSDTKTMLLSRLRDGASIPDKFNEHLKLLWKRGEVKYDGEYYLS